MKGFKILFLGFITIILTSCASTNRLTLSVKEPAPVFFPSDINSIGIINRSLPSKKNILNDIDKILIIEGKELDKIGSESVLVGLYDAYSMSNRFEDIKIIENHGMRSPGLGIYPASLTWEDVEDLCRTHKVDVIYSLAFYDSNSSLKYSLDTIRKKNALGLKIPMIRHKARLSTSILAGWRIYNPATKTILDEFTTPTKVNIMGSGLNPVEALKAIIGRKEAVIESSRHMGQDYAQRIFDYKIRRSRNYFVRGTNNFEIGQRRAQTGDWDGAAELWEREVNNPKSKIAGRACYNMAIINEINGNLEDALQWASKSYIDYKNKEALRYVKILEHRIANLTLLNQ